MSHVEEATGTRRDFLYVATASAGAVTAGAAVWPLVTQMNPSADVQALSSIQVDVDGVDEGAQITLLWQGKPVFIRRRTAEEIESARNIELSELIDGLARNDNDAPDAPALDQNRALDEAGEWLVMIGVCTHLGCVPLGDAGDFQRLVLPLPRFALRHQSGRIRKRPGAREPSGSGGRVHFRHCHQAGIRRPKRDGSGIPHDRIQADRLAPRSGWKAACRSSSLICTRR